ncbi:MAG: replication restart helicase PriA [Kiritimatiellia bacterium]
MVRKNSVVAMSGIARVLVDGVKDRHFDYAIPPEMTDRVHVGSRVEIPFGPRHAFGFVVELPARSAYAPLKPIRAVVGEKPLLSEPLLRLARWLADYYCATLAEAMRTILPAAVRRRGARFKERLVASLAPRAEVGEPPKLTPLQKRVVEFLRTHGSTHLVDLMRRLQITTSPCQTLAKKGIVEITTVTPPRNPLANRTILATQPHVLTSEQAVALEQIRVAIARMNKKSSEGEAKRRDPHVILLFGVTGSGKTEVYLQAIEHVLQSGRGAIVLVPEIALTPQTVERFLSRLGNRIAVLHSHLSDGERHDEWHRIQRGEASVVIGARSAVFAPVKNLGLIVVDEEHEPSYKQEESPRYHARDVAVMRGYIEGCPVVLGSATPSLESWLNMRRGKYRLVRLTRRVDNHKMPLIRVVDMRLEAQRTGGLNVFSKPLVQAIGERLNNREQTILFLNRRGFAAALICRACGYVAMCEQCSVACTYHRKDDLLRCHICGSARPTPRCCPACQDPAFRFTGIGTERVESIVQKLFPYARVRRMDTDMTTAKNAHEQILCEFRTGRTDILVGTQMIAKGLHFPNVTLVGVIYADLGLHMPDFRAGERTFQLLAQVAGRAGRGEISGEVIVQTFTPFHPAVQAARRLDYEGFSDQEIEFRRELFYPPFSRLICLTLRSKAEEKVRYFVQILEKRLRAILPSNGRLSGPVPAPLARAKGWYRYQILLRHETAGKLVAAVRSVLAGIQFPKEVRCSVDVDALNLL